MVSCVLGDCRAVRVGDLLLLLLLWNCVLDVDHVVGVHHVVVCIVHIPHIHMGTCELLSSLATQSSSTN